MNAKILLTGLLAATVAAVALYPALPRTAAGGAPTPEIPQTPANARRVEAVFVLDTTGSMSGLIQAAKEKIWSIATTMAQADPAPEIRIGLVGYRDRGDAYVTKVVDLSTDLDSMYAALMEFRADGGGDTPESVNEALHAAVHEISWSASQNDYKVIFLVGDAPPHMDYQDEPRYPEIVAAATRKGIVVNPIQCGGMLGTVAPWQETAALGGGRYFRVEQAGSAVAVATPYDAEIAKLSAELDSTRLFFGRPEVQAAMQAKLEATALLTEASSVQALARRGVFNATASGAANLAGEHDLVAAVAEGRVDVAALPESELPPALAAVPADERERIVAVQVERRAELQRRIADLAAQRDEYLEEQVVAAGRADGSLDAQIFEAVRDQAGTKGLRYDGGPKF